MEILPVTPSLLPTNVEPPALDTHDADLSSRIHTIESQVSRYKRWAFAALLLGLMAALPGLFLFDSSSDQLSQLGDYLSGAVAPIWSLAGLIIVYIAFLGQRIQILQQEREIRQNRSELQLNRQELAFQREEMEEQNATLRLQAFENTLFPDAAAAP
jgi:cell shape-determining protein MreC